MHNGIKDRLQKIEGLIGQIQNASDRETRATALELIQILMEFHAAAVDQMMEITSEAGDAGWNIIERFGRDPVVSNMLLLHGLHPLDLDTRVRDALETVRPYLHSHGGDVELIEIAEGAVRLKLTGSCNGCPSSAATLKTAIETAIHETAPDVTSIQCEAGPELISIQTAS
jgi:Fe-S cluster biogenesis protein NfuA